MSLSCSCAGRVAEGHRLRVEPLGDRADDHLRGPGAVLEQQPGARAQRLLGQPAQGGVELAGHPRRGVDAAAIRSPREMSMSSASSSVTTPAAHRPTSSGPSAVSMPATVVRRPAGQHDDLVAGRDGARGDLAGVAAVVVQLVAAASRGRITYCTGNRNGASASGPGRPAPSPGARAASGRRTRGCARERSTTLSPTSAETGIARRPRPGSPATAAQRGEVLGDRGERLLVVVDQVDLVDGEDQVRHAAAARARRRAGGSARRRRCGRRRAARPAPRWTRR